MQKVSLFVGFMTVITQDFIQISPRRGRNLSIYTGTSCLKWDFMVYQIANLGEFTVSTSYVMFGIKNVYDNYTTGTKTLPH